MAAISCLFITAINAQESPFISQKIKDAYGNPVLLGKCSRDALKEAPFANWFVANYNNYVVDSATCQFIRPLLKDKKITIFMGTWCGDSQREVPRILKMLDCCDFPPQQLQLVMVSNQQGTYKQSPQHEEQGRNIVRVPTVIVETAGREQGRIVEYPIASLEKDLLKILRGETYIPNYHQEKVSAK